MSVLYFMCRNVSRDFVFVYKKVAALIVLQQNGHLPFVFI